MAQFEVIHDLWLQDLSGTACATPADQAATQAAAQQLIEFLGLGSTAILESPPLIGDMTVGEGPEPRFVVVAKGGA